MIFPWLSRDCIRDNNNNDLLKYASLIIITDNRGGKRDRPFAVKHSFAVEFLTLRIFTSILPETLITTLLKSPAILRGARRKGGRRGLPLSNYRYSDKNLVRHFSPWIYEDLKISHTYKKIFHIINERKSISRWRTILILLLPNEKWIATHGVHSYRTRTRGNENRIVRKDRKEGNGQEVRERDRQVENAYFEAGLIEITVNHV